MFSQIRCMMEQRFSFELPLSGNLIFNLKAKALKSIPLSDLIDCPKNQRTPRFRIHDDVLKSQPQVKELKNMKF